MFCVKWNFRTRYMMEDISAAIYTCINCITCQSTMCAALSLSTQNIEKTCIAV